MQTAATARPLGICGCLYLRKDKTNGAEGASDPSARVEIPRQSSFASLPVIRLSPWQLQVAPVATAQGGELTAKFDGNAAE